MAVNILPYFGLLFLGSTIDRRNFEYQAFRHVAVPNNTVVINSTIMEYKVLEDTFPYSSFGLPCDFALFHKLNRINDLGLPFSSAVNLLQDTQWQHHDVTIIFYSLYRTIDVSLNEDAAVLQDSMNNSYRKTYKTHTHYVDTLKYGAYANLVIRLECNNIDDVPIVRERVVSILGESGEITPDIKNKWKEVQDAVYDRGGLKSYVWTKSAWSSGGYLIFPEGGVMGNFDQMLNISKMGEGNGNPMYMEIKPLHDVDPSFPEIKPNDYLEQRVAQMIRMIDDVKNTNKDISNFFENSALRYIRQLNEELDKLYEIVENVYYNLTSASRRVNIFAEEEDPEVTAAIQLYEDGLEEGATSYFSTFLNMTKKYES